VARDLPRVLAATALVAVLPAFVVLALQLHGVIGSPILAAVISAAASLAVYHVAAARWQRREGTRDVLFGELMLWGWIGRCVQERRLAGSLGRLGPSVSGLSRGERVALLRRTATDLEVRDPYTHGHSRRVARYTAITAKQMGVGGSALQRLRLAAYVHDVGKLETPVDVLCKPGRLTADEFAEIQRHPADGEALVSMLDDEIVSDVVRHHHERLDGSGYPDGLAGDEITLGSRIVAVADTFDALTSTRSYRAARPHQEAFDILDADAGTRLDAAAVAAFRRGYLGQRSLGTWLALSSFGRVAVWLAGDAVGSGVRLAALTAGTVAIGTGALSAHVARHTPSAPGTTATAAVAARGGSAAQAADGGTLVLGAGPAGTTARRDARRLRRDPTEHPQAKARRHASVSRGASSGSGALAGATVAASAHAHRRGRGYGRGHGGGGVKTGAHTRGRGAAHRAAHTRAHAKARGRGTARHTAGAGHRRHSSTRTHHVSRSGTGRPHPTHRRRTAAIGTGGGQPTTTTPQHGHSGAHK
jgi:HD-GYP domain-containing protein (c-di-GMP phosphodiesterase class II)